MRISDWGIRNKGKGMRLGGWEAGKPESKVEIRGPRPENGKDRRSEVEVVRRMIAIRYLLLGVDWEVGENTYSNVLKFLEKFVGRQFDIPENFSQKRTGQISPRMMR